MKKVLAFAGSNHTASINHQLLVYTTTLIHDVDVTVSSGGRGGVINLKFLIQSLPYQGAKIGASFSLPAFADNFKKGKIIHKDLLGELKESIGEFKEALHG